eukprot:g418.t1
MLGNGMAKLTDLTKSFGKTGVGSVGIQVSSLTDLKAQNEAQKQIVESSRLGIPIAFTAETLHSGGHAGCTVYPMPAGQGASWNKTLVELIAAQNALQARASGTVHGLAPVLNVATDPRFGRTQECFGEDPHLVGAMGIAAVKGLQGELSLAGCNSSDLPNCYFETPATKILSQAKHFGAYAYGGRDGYSADLSERTLFERYFLPWLRYAQHGGRGAMASHNSINYEPVHGSYRWLTQVLRDELGFGAGYIGADSHNVVQLSSTQHVAASTSDAAILAVEAGLDQDLNTLHNTPFGTLVGSSAHSAQDPSLSALNASIDRAAGNVLRYKFAARLFDAPYANETAAAFAARDSPAARQLAREAAQQSVVLLINSATAKARGKGEARGQGKGQHQQLLPLDPSSLPSRIAVIGPNADDAKATLGDYNPTQGVPVVTVLGALVELANKTTAGAAGAADADAGAQAGARARANATAGGATMEVRYARGANIKDADTSGLADAVALHKNWSELTVLVVGDSTAGSAGFGHESCGEGADRDKLDLPGGQMALLEALLRAGTGGDADADADTGAGAGAGTSAGAGAGTGGGGGGGGGTAAPVIVILIHGRPATFGPGNALLRGGAGAAGVGALLAAWRPGEEGGHAIVDLLTGRASPSARLTQAWVQSAGAVRSPANPWMQDFPANANPPKDYFDSTAAPLFPMGFGLSYADFTLGTMTLEPASVRVPASSPPAIDQLCNVSVTITATGGARSRPSACVVQIYAERPLTRGFNTMQRQLVGFGKSAPIAAGSGAVTLVIPVRVADLARYMPATATAAAGAGAGLRRRAQSRQGWVVDEGTWTLHAATCAGSAWGGWTGEKDKVLWGCEGVSAKLQVGGVGGGL